MKVRKILRDRKGNSTPLTIALILGLLFLICAMAEFFRFAIIVHGVREGLQQAVVAVAADNFDETYHCLREGYSGGYVRTDSRWKEKLEYADVYKRLDKLLGTKRIGSYHIKSQDKKYDYRLSGLSVKIINIPLAQGNTKENLEADARIKIEIPLLFRWERLPPLVMEIRTRAAYMPKF